MRGRASLVGVLGLAGLVLGVVPVQPAAAAGAENVQFEVGGTFPDFPCQEACSVAFSGLGNGGGNVNTVINGVPHVATFTVVAGTVSGSAIFSQPGIPLCPWVGFAASSVTGSFTLSGGATGVISRTDPLLPTGTVSDASTTLDFSYTRVGVTPVIEITGGTVTLEYFIPGAGSGTITESIVTGAGTGVFEVNPALALVRCYFDPGELDFEITGDAAIVTN